MTLANPARLPLATLVILLLNFAAAFFTLGNSDALLKWGFTPGPMAAMGVGERFITAFTSMFIHLDPVHLLGNMLFLAAAGPPIERVAGPIRFAGVYLLGGLAGIGLHALMSKFVMVAAAGEPIAGASAAIAALVGYALLRFYRVRVPMLPKLYVPLYAIILVWVLLQILGGIWVVRQFGGAVGFWAHLGGFVMGLALAFLFGAGRVMYDEAWTEHLSEAEARGEAAKGAAAKGRLTTSPKDAETLVDLFESADAIGNDDEAIVALTDLAGADPAHRNGFAIRRLAERHALGRIPVARRLRLGSELASSLPDISEFLFQSILEDPPSDDTPKALVSLIELLHASDVRAAKHFANKLDSEHSLAPETETARQRWPDIFG
ncbi:MAG: rhomboid family intramembrane serine protease [Armatimonadetes bacterium]|nr:rhomboid family intramembrane serine protease [Armatimonadota bacterium]